MEINDRTLYKYFAGELTHDEKAQVKAWVEASQENADTLRRERKLFNAMVLAGPDVAGESAAPVVQQGSTARRKTLRRTLLAVAATFLATLVITATVKTLFGSDETLYSQTVTVPAGQRVNVTLPDGTDVWLNSGTTMQYPLSFMKDKREVKISGEAYLKVTHNDHLPFVVHMPSTNVEVLGTEFNVREYPGQRTAETSLKRGRVRVTVNSDNGEFTLEPGQRFVKDGNRCGVTKITDYDQYRWKEGLYCFSSKSLARVIDDLERYYQVKVVVERSDLNKRVFTGKFYLADGIDNILSMIGAEAGFTYDKQGNTIYIK